MRLALAPFAAVCALAASSAAVPAVPVAIALDKPFSLRPGEVAQAADQGVRVGFDSEMQAPIYPVVAFAHIR